MLHHKHGYEIKVSATNIEHLAKQAINYVDVLMSQEAITPETHQLITDNLQCTVMHSERIVNVMEANTDDDSAESYGEDGPFNEAAD